MNEIRTLTEAEQGGKVIVAVSFSIEGDMKYLSHRDTLRLLQRCLSRAGLPVKYSGGYNPHQRVKVVLPRNVGIGSGAELALIELSRSCPAERVKEGLSGVLPAGLRIGAVGLIDPQEQPRPERVDYLFTLSGGLDRERLDENIRGFMASSTWPVYRARRGRHPEKNIDLRKYVKNLHRRDNVVQCSFRISERGSARPDELMEALELNEPGQVSDIYRTVVGYEGDLQAFN